SLTDLTRILLGDAFAEALGRRVHARVDRELGHIRKDADRVPCVLEHRLREHDRATAARAVNPVWTLDVRMVRTGALELCASHRSVRELPLLQPQLRAERARL